MNKADILMVESIRNIQNKGHKDVNPRPHWHDGTPAHTLSVNGVTHKYDISDGEFPITSLREIKVDKAIGEILWIYQDCSNDLDVLANKYGVHWWDDWDCGDRTIKYCYGHTVDKYDLTKKLLDGIIADPYGRRHIINLWQEDEFRHEHGLKPCCFQTQFLVRGEYIDMCLYQRSSDWLTAGNINQMQYVAFMMMVAKHCGYKPGEFIHFTANQQIYDRHMENADELLRRFTTLCKMERETKTPIKKPRLVFEPESNDFWSFKVDDFHMEDYDPIKPQLKFEVAV